MKSKREPTRAELYLNARRKDPEYEASFQAARVELSEANEAMNNLAGGDMVSLSFPRKWLEHFDIGSAGKQ